MASLPEEVKRLNDNHDKDLPKWHKWGPYVSERSWGTVREDYSPSGNAWDYFPFDHAPIRAYRWGEDGIAGLCDRYQIMALSVVVWNHKDPILKERLFGLNSSEGNHGEDVKECYYYEDNLPSHAYMRYRYRYCQDAFPYQQLIEENAKRSLADLEYEIYDTGVFDNSKYFDIVIEYAKFDPEDIGIQITVTNHADSDACLDVLLQLVYRNVWEFHSDLPHFKMQESLHSNNACCIECQNTDDHIPSAVSYQYQIGQRFLYGPKDAEVIFTDNETNKKALFDLPNHSKYLKDGFHRYIIHDEQDAINPHKTGSKAAVRLKEIVFESKEEKTFCFRFTKERHRSPLDKVSAMIEKRRKEADAYYDSITPSSAPPEEAWIMRRALASLLWSKQIYLFEVQKWITGDDAHDPPSPARKSVRNNHWRHLLSKRVMLMPDKWEYPWFAAWDLAFHCLSLALVDLEFAKEQLWLLLFDQFQHPNGQIPAYEWEFSDLNPPVQAWAAWELYQQEKQTTGNEDLSFLKRCFHKLMINFVWWVNKVDSRGNNIFEGGFLGLDNITVIDRSEGVPGGGVLEQSDGTGWMGQFCLMLMRIALELAKHDRDFESLAVKFFEHFVYIAAALHRSGVRDIQIWNEEDGFFYDVICYPNGEHEQIKVRSMVGIIPLFAIDLVSDDELKQFPEFAESFNWFLKHRSPLTQYCVTKIEGKGYMLSLMKIKQMKRILKRVWDPEEFRSNYGLRSLSKYHKEHPYVFGDHTVEYDPGESRESIKGGNSNWRGPIWFPSNYLLISTLRKIDSIFGDGFIQEGDDLPAPRAMADHFTKALITLFKDDHGRPIYGDHAIFKDDPNFKDQLMFFEHFHGDTGRGLGASHQTGWTALIANLIKEIY